MTIQLQKSKGGFKNRDDFPARWCKNKVCAEVGVLYGSYSRAILAQSPSKHYMIDCWQSQPESVYPGDDANRTNQDGDITYNNIVREFGNKSNVEIIRAFSYDASLNFPDNSLDFCFIDACHTLPMALIDCMAWWPKVKPGGILSGHDYNLGDLPNCRGLQVAEALESFLYVLHRSELDYVTDELDSWAIQK